MAAPPASKLPPRRIVELEIVALAPQGRGIARVDALDVRVPFTLPGARVRATLWRPHPAPGDADLLELLVAAPERIAPRCPLYGLCGGCQLQHLPYEHQLAWKTSLVRDLVAAHALPIDVSPTIGSPRAFGYRSKITPHHDHPRPDRPLTIGFLKVNRRHDVVDVEACPLATDGINARLPSFRAEIAAAAARRKKGSTFLVREATSGVTTDPDARVTETVGNLSLEFFAREFFQNNPFLLPRLVDFVIDAAAATGARTLIDTYSGSGLFALAGAARFADVIGVEVSAGAIVAARANATRNHLTNVRFVAADSARIFAELTVSGADAAVIVDPPRKGCDDAFLNQLCTFAPRAIVYVSCNPETQARDLARLLHAGYRARVLQPFDMFPQTRHVESVAVLERG